MFNNFFMETNIIGIRELHKRLKEVSKDALSGRSFIVVKNTRPVFRIEPYKEKKKKYSLEHFEKENLSRGFDDKIIKNIVEKVVNELEKEKKEFLSLLSSSPSYGKLKGEKDEDEKRYSLKDVKPIK